MDEQQILIGPTVIVVLAVAGQSLGQRLGIPAILVLLVLGMVAGPFTGLLDPDAILGDLLFPLVSLSVGLILFEGGLLLRFKDLTTEASSVVRRLLSLGVLVTWLGAAAAGVVVLGLSPSVSAVLGALLTVSGPTVVLPLLSYIRPSGNVEAVLRWEGIFVDAIGASLAVLVFDAVLAGGSIFPPLQISISVLVTLLIGAAVGAGFAALLVTGLYRRGFSTAMQSAVPLASVLGAFTVADLLRAESGLFAATLMAWRWPTKPMFQPSGSLSSKNR
jgi:NhaP-type Na+/H+ or K+/H+ antiporter